VIGISERMSLKWKLLALAVLPLLAATVAIGLLVSWQAGRLGEQQARLLKTSLMEQKRVELRHAVALVAGELAVLPRGSEAQASERAKALIGAAHYGEDGYFFAYDRDGTCLVHPKQPELVGKNLWALRDSRGRRVIPGLVETAERGDGFQEYMWEKPSTGRPTEKLAYAALLPRFGWVLGTGVYLDDVASASQAARREAQSSVEHTLSRLAGVALLALGLVFTGTMLLNLSEQRQADARLRTANERLATLRMKERTRIAAELHEGLSQLLVATKFHFELTAQKLAENSAEARASLEKGLARLAESISDVRRISHALRPTAIDELGWTRALHELMEEFPKRAGVKLTFTDALGGVVPPEPYASELYRIAQEAITNIERFAQASEVTITLHRDAAGDVSLKVLDNGRGFDVERTEREPGGIGLINLRERAEDLGGSFRITSRPGRTELSVHVKVSATP